MLRAAFVVAAPDADGNSSVASTPQLEDMHTPGAFLPAVSLCHETLTHDLCFLASMHVLPRAEPGAETKRVSEAADKMYIYNRFYYFYCQEASAYCQSP